MTKTYSPIFTVLLFVAGDDDDPWWDWVCVSHQHDSETCNTRRRCAYCWLKTEIDCAGGDSLLLGERTEPIAGCVIRVTGRLWSSECHSIDGTDYDTGFEPVMSESLKGAL